MALKRQSHLIRHQRSSYSSTSSSASLSSCYDNLMKYFVFACLFLATICVVSSSAKNLDLSHDLDSSNSYLETSHHHHQSHSSSFHHHNRNRRLQRRDSNSKDGNYQQQCNDVRSDFDRIDIQLPQHFNEKGKDNQPQHH